MSIPKFRLAWKGGAQEQMNILEKMALLLEKILIELERANGKLTSIDNGVTSVDGKMTTQLLLSQEIVDNTSCACNALKDVISNQMEQTQILNSDLLLSQQIADNTSCACNALGDVNGKLDEIIDLLDKPNPVYDFVLNTNSYTITDSDIQKGYFDISGVSTKNGILFNSVTTDLSATWVGQCTVFDGDIIRIGLFRDELSGGLDTQFDLIQSESNIVQSLHVVYIAGIPNEFSVLSHTTEVDYFDTRTVITIDVVSYYGGQMVLPFLGANWVISSHTVHSFGSEGKSFYRLKVKTNVSSFSDLVKVPLSIYIRNDFHSDTVAFSISGVEFGVELYGSNYTTDDGIKGYDPMTKTGLIRFYFVQNILSKQNGGLSGVDWDRPIVHSFFDWDYSGNMGVIKTGVSNSFFRSNDGSYVDSDIGLKFIVGEHFYSLNLPIGVTLPVGMLLMGANTLTTPSNLFYTIPLAACPPLGPMLPMQWQTSNFNTFEYPLLPNGYSGNKTIGALIPVEPPYQADAYALCIGYHNDPLFLMQYGWSMAMRTGLGLIKDTYQYYLIVDNKACYAAVVIS